MRYLALIALLLLAPLPASASTIVAQSYALPAMAAPMAVNVYRPDGNPPPQGWPVVYLLHGLGGNQGDWLVAGNLQPTLDGLIADGTVQPMVVVMPAAGNNWYVDTRPAGGQDDVETAITSQLSEKIEAEFPVRKDAGGRAIAGLSMGGAGALRLGIGHPDLYAAIAALSPAIWENVPIEDLDKAPADIDLIIDSAYFHWADPDTLTSGVDLPPAGPHFSGAFGDPFDARRYNSENVFTLLAGAVRNNTPLPAIFMLVGDHDSHKLWRGAIALYETLLADNRNVAFRIYDGDHSWELWRAHIGEALTFINANFKPAPAASP
ncbi:MAG: esterase/lipase [Devosia sp.]|uniref:alpha/beta hydrolase n=1 Tax=Devosia sp. TaxID=1871048 RepID=UPI002636567D|nr:alpha/beta hydrolase family protein [Devosia sp.]MDB5589378.1 esterase/lipase [Devosia sp.]